MTDREKLIAIIKDCRTYVAKTEELADHLLANGVTIQKWIPVTERLPEDDLPKDSKKKQIKVLTALISDNRVRTVRSQMRYKDTWYDSWQWKYSGSKITHWLPLPEPPKEEKNNG